MKKFERVLHPFYLIFFSVLILNDIYFKSEFTSVVSGKLSDFTGVFCLYIFLYELFHIRFNPKSSKIYSSLIVIICFGALQFSAVIIFLNEALMHIGIYGLNLTPDKSDLIALVMIPFGTVFIRKTESYSLKMKANYKLNLKVMIFTGSCFWFVATSFVGFKTVSNNKRFALKESVAFTLFQIEKFYDEKGYLIEGRSSESDSIYAYNLFIEEGVIEGDDYKYYPDYNLLVTFLFKGDSVSIVKTSIKTFNRRVAQEYADSLVRYDFLIPLDEYAKKHNLFNF